MRLAPKEQRPGISQATEPLVLSDIWRAAPRKGVHRRGNRTRLVTLAFYIGAKKLSGSETDGNWRTENLPVH